jgi:BAAT / Acyl-CoA thioester hydrolase C terminal.
MINTSVKNEGFDGVLYQVDNKKDKIIIVMSGSNGGLKMTKQVAESYYKNGIPALALGLFKTKETPKELVSVPVEYVEKAIKYLKQQGYQKIGIDGMSKGSEMALLAASMFSDISCVIARVPSYFISEGLARKGNKRAPSGTSCWSYNGKDFPYAPYKTRTINLYKIIKEEKELKLLTINGDKDVTPETIIPVERINGPVLLISSKHDEVWPSYESATIIDDKLNSVSFPYTHKHVALEYMSHAALTHVSWLIKKGFKTERQNPKECANDRIKMKQEILSWVNDIWQ